MDPEELRADIPALDETAYMNTGACGPAPTRVVDAARESLAYQELDAPFGEGAYEAVYESFEESRAAAAAFLGADPDEIALTNSTADGVATVADSIDWDPGDVVVRTDLEHPAGILPWDRLADVAGIEVRVVGTDRGRLPMDEFKAATDDARLVCLSSLSWNYGTRLPVAEAVSVAHDAGAEVLVDGVQSVGQTAVDVGEWGADYVAAAGHKWLLGVWGAGILYVDREAAERLRPRRTSYRSVVDPPAEEYEFKPGAKRLEIGTASPVPHAALSTAMETIDAVGLGTVEARIERLTDRLKDGLDPDRLLSPREYESGLVTVAVDDPEATVERLAEAGIVVRSLPYPEAVRASIHAFNTAEDVDRLLGAL